MIRSLLSTPQPEGKPMRRRRFLSAGLSAPLACASGTFVPAWAQDAPNPGTPTLPTRALAG
jgi:hypothetical protein